MSTITYLTSLVQQAIQRLNNYEANAKKVDELPHQTTLEPSSKIPVSRAGISEHLTVQQIISSIENSNFNQLTSVGSITIDGTNIIVEPVSGQINGLLYSTSVNTIIPITLCATGFNRKDILVLTTSNTVIAISGEETDGAIVLAPNVPLDAVYITEFDVNDSSIGIPVDPSIGTSFIEKSDFLVHNFVGSGSDVVIPLLANGASEIRLQSGLTPLTSIDGFDLSLITGNPDAKVPYNGKVFLIRNTATAPITLKNSGVADFKFYSLSSTDVVIPVNGTITVKYGFYGGESSFTEYFRNWTEPIDLSTKADLVGGKVPASQLPSYVDDVIEGYFNGTNFYTDAGFTNLITPESSKIYINLSVTPATQYRWSGSAYVQIGGGGSSKKTDKITYTHTSANNINVLNTWFRFYNSQGWNNNVINANSETGSTPNLIFTNGSSKPILPNSKLVKCVLSFTWASSATPSSFEVYVGTSEFTEGVVDTLGGINQQTLVLETVNFTSSTAMNLIKNLTINPHSALPLNKLFFAVREKANAKQYSFQLDFYFEEQ